MVRGRKVRMVGLSYTTFIPAWRDRIWNCCRRGSKRASTTTGFRVPTSGGISQTIDESDRHSVRTHSFCPTTVRCWYDPDVPKFSPKTVMLDSPVAGALFGESRCTAGRS
eukprot:2877628-Rhodomonas_salina.1